MLPAIHSLILVMAFLMSCSANIFSQNIKNADKASYNSPIPIVTTVQPVYLITKAITAGIEEPIRLIRPNTTGHHIVLTPQQRMMMDRANLILWVDPTYEVSIAPLLVDNPKAIALSTTPDLSLFPLRTTSGRTLTHTIDPHVWFDANNAKKMGWYIAKVRASQYPQYAKAYFSNYQQFAKQINKALDHPTIQRQYIAYHDAYHYLESDQALNFIESLTVDEQQRPSIQKVLLLKQRAQQSRYPICVIASNKSQQEFIEKLTKLPTALISEVLGNANSYVEALEYNQKQIRQCYSKKNKY